MKDYKSTSLLGEANMTATGKHFVLKYKKADSSRDFLKSGRVCQKLWLR